MSGPGLPTDGAAARRLGDDRARRVEPRSRFAPGRDAPSPDQIDIVLGDWTATLSEEALQPVAVTARLSRLAQLLEQRMGRTSSRFGLDWGQFLVLAALRGSGPPFRMSPRELHRLCLLSPVAVTNRLYRLEAKGLIERTSDPTDRRSLPVLLTALGRSTVERAMTACLEVERDLLAGLEDAARTTTLGTVRQLLAAYDAAPPSRRRSLALAVEAIDPELARAIEEAEAASAPPVVPVEPTWWPGTPRELERLQRKLARRAQDEDPWRWTSEEPPQICGVFVSLPSGKHDELQDVAWAAAVVMRGSDEVATATATRHLQRPYRPGYLALTVGPILEDVVHALPERPDIIVVNAAGRDHPRGAGLAIQLGAAVDIPTVGVTERPDVGVAPEPGTRRGDWTPVRVDDALVGFRIRTLSRASSITAHAAWRTAPETARDIVLHASGRGRVPAPIHAARRLSRRLRTEHESAAGTGLQDGIHA